MAISEKLVRHQVDAAAQTWHGLRVLGLWIGLSLGLWAVIIGSFAWIAQLAA